MIVALWAAVVALAVAGLFELNRWLVLGAIVLVVVAGGLAFRRRLRREYRELTAQGIDQVWIDTRWTLPLAAAVGAWHYVNHPDQAIQAIVVSVVFMGLIWITESIKVAFGESAPYVANIPGAPKNRVDEPRIGYSAFSIILVAVIVGWSLLTMLPGGSLIVWVWSALVTCVLAVVAVLNLRYGRNMRQINRALAELAPVFAIPHDGASLFHLEMWTPYFVRSGLPFIQITTKMDTFERRAASSPLPIVAPFSAKKSCLNATLPKTLKALFYPRNGTKNIQFIALRPKLTHVFLHHGDGDKPASSSERSGQYDVLVVAGEAAVARYAMRGVEIPREKFKVLGRPQVANILEATKPIGEIEVPTVAYAPTWRGNSEAANFSSLHIGPDIVRDLLTRNVRVIFRPHAAGQKHPPHAAAITEIKKLLKENRQATGIQHIWGAQAEENWSFADVANESDMMVADVSGVITDYMQSGKPFIMVSTKMGADQFRDEFPSSNSSYVIVADDLTTIAPALDDALGMDSLKATRLERRSYYLGGFTGDGSPQAFVDYLHELASE